VAKKVELSGSAVSAAVAATVRTMVAGGRGRGLHGDSDGRSAARGEGNRPRARGKVVPWRWMCGGLVAACSGSRPGAEGRWMWDGKGAGRGEGTFLLFSVARPHTYARSLARVGEPRWFYSVSWPDDSEAIN
jgi:hypothetical protein